jgi:MHS family proline/betaine transporter-like MFS transporter
LAPEIGSSFFPKSSKELQLINSFGVYLAAFLMRPLGAILFGEMGDRMVGRKNALAFSIVLITVPSVAMGMLPTYDMWGAAAPILLVILRMMQGLSVGGQLAGSYVLSIEQSSSLTRGFRGSICTASSVSTMKSPPGNCFGCAVLLIFCSAVGHNQVGGFLLASAVTSVVRHILSEDAVNEWGWRIPFWFSLVLAPILYKIVRNTEESKLWSERSEQKETEKLIRESEHEDRPAVIDLFASPFRRRQLAGMIGVLSAVTSSFYILFLWTPLYLSELTGYMSDADADLLNFVVVGFHLFFLLAAGKFSDTFEHRMDLMRIGLLGIVVGCPTMFGMFESESFWGYLLGQLQFAVCLAFVEGSIAAWEVELWMADPTMSFTGVAVGHNLAATLFGGTMPLVATFLFYRAEQLAGDNEDALFPRLIPGLYISVLGIISLLCISVVVRHPHDVRTGDIELRKAVHAENKKFKEAKKLKKKRKQIEAQLAAHPGKSPIHLHQ